jgi:polyhydroxyalkanoate synthesis regulator phasin
MTEEDLKQVVENLLEMQNNNDYNFQLLSAKIDALQRQVAEMSNLHNMLRAPREGDIQIIDTPDA